MTLHLSMHLATWYSILCFQRRLHTLLQKNNSPQITFICWVYKLICQKLTNPQMACLCFSIIKFKCDNPMQMFFYSLHCGGGCSYQGFYGFLCFFPFFFINIFGQRGSSSGVCFFFLSNIPAHAVPALETLVQSKSCSPSTPIKQALFIELWGAKSLTHSVTHINLPPHCPPCLSPCSPNAISLPPSLTRRLMTI